LQGFGWIKHKIFGQFVWHNGILGWRECLPDGDADMIAPGFDKVSLSFQNFVTWRYVFAS
jgi:hypothetical protein